MASSLHYHRPSSVVEACDLLLELGTDARPLAGGTDLVVDLHGGALDVRHLVSLGGLSELRRIELDGDTLRIGSLVTPAQLEESETVRSRRPELLDAVGVFGTPQVRNRATVGGNLCTAASCGDLAPLLMVLDTEIAIVGAQGARRVTLGSFFSDHRRTVLEPGEIVTEVAVRARRTGEGASYEAFGLRQAGAITVAAVAASLRLEEGACVTAGVALGAVAPTPVRVPAAEERLVGSTLEAEVLREAARYAREAAEPISDLRGSAEHRHELVEALARRALEAAVGRTS